MFTRVLFWACLGSRPGFGQDQALHGGRELGHWTSPWPLTLTVCGLPLALSKSLKVPATAPAVAGANAALVVQLAAAASRS